MLDSFIAITRQVIAEDGIGEFLPTLMFPDRDAVHVLEDASDATSHEIEAVAWRAQMVPAGEDYVLAFRVNEDRFKIVGRVGGSEVDRLCAVVA